MPSSGDLIFYSALFLLAILSGATASVVGFGIGSLLTPLLALPFGTAIAIAAVSVPHAIATAFRGYRLRAHVDRFVLLRFGLWSAAGGLMGALFYTKLGSDALTRILGALLVLTAAAQLTGWTRRWTPTDPWVGLLGAASGFFGGVAGNQGGLRAVALSSFRL